MTILADSESAFDAMVAVLPSAMKPVCTFTNPTIADAQAIKQRERSEPAEGGLDAATAPSVEVVADFFFKRSVVDDLTLHDGQTTWSDGTYTWRLRNVRGRGGPLVTLEGWRAKDIEET